MTAQISAADIVRWGRPASLSSILSGWRHIECHRFPGRHDADEYSPRSGDNDTAWTKRNYCRRTGIDRIRERSRLHAELGHVTAELCLGGRRQRDAGAGVIINTGQAGSGLLGREHCAESWRDLQRGHSSAAHCGSNALPGVGASTQINFVDSPVMREVINVSAFALPASFASGTVTFTGGSESGADALESQSEHRRMRAVPASH